jgi:uncharacterized protein
MKSKLLYQEGGLKTFAVVSDKGDDVRKTLLELANANRFSDAHLTAIGAFTEVTLGYFDRQRKDYKEIPIREQVEVLSFVGNIAVTDGKAQLHAHIVVGKSDGSAHGGHFLGGRVWPTLEMMITELPAHLRRVHDRETGLTLAWLLEPPFPNSAAAMAHLFSQPTSGNALLCRASTRSRLFCNPTDLDLPVNSARF